MLLQHLVLKFWDVNEPGAYGDTFRIKIWKTVEGDVVYDNKLGSDDDGYAGTIIEGDRKRRHT
jgi:hypothetical protein